MILYDNAKSHVWDDEHEDEGECARCHAYFSREFTCDCRGQYESDPSPETPWPQDPDQWEGC